MAWACWHGSVVHRLPGRLRVQIPGLRGNVPLARALAGTLGRVPGVRRAAPCAHTGHLLLVYDPRRVSEAGVARHLIPGAAAAAPGAAASRTARAAAPAPCPAPVPARDDPDVRQAARQAAVAGGALVLVAAKRALVGPSALSRSWHTYHVSGLITLVASYPFLRRGVTDLCRRGRLSGDLLIGTAGLAALVLRENLPGLGALFLASLGHLAFARAIHRCRRAGAAAPGRHDPWLEAQHGRRAARWSGWAMAAALLTWALTRDGRRALATLIAAAPAAPALACRLPLAAAAAATDPRATLSGAAVSRRNQALAGLLNAGGLALAATGALGPLAAAAWHNLTTVAILGSSARLFRSLPVRE